MITTYINYITANRGLSTNTARAYAHALHAFAAAQVGKSWSTITADDVNAYVATLHNAHKAANSVSVAVCALRSFYRFLGHFYGLQSNPCAYIAVPKRTDMVAKSVCMADVNFVLQRCSNTAIRVGIMLMTMCGLRVSEVRGLRWDDISGNRVLVHGKGKKERYVYLHGAMQDELATMPRTSAYVLGVTEDRAYRYAIWAEFDRHGIYCTSHMLRHTFASYCVNAGMPISTLQLLLGHDDLRTTQRYLHADNSTVATQLQHVF